MITEHADADLNRNKEVVLRFMRLMDGAPSDLDVLDEVLAPDLRLQIGAVHLDRNPDKGPDPNVLHSVSRLHAYI